MLALRGAEVLLMPHAARFKPWPDTPEGEAAARRHSHDFVGVYALRARENACFAVLASPVPEAEAYFRALREELEAAFDEGVILVERHEVWIP